MASTDWTDLTGVTLAPSPIPPSGFLGRAPTAGERLPTKDLGFSFGMGMLGPFDVDGGGVPLDRGVFGMFGNQAGFAPVASGKGMGIRGYAKKSIRSSSLAGFSPFFFVHLQGTHIAGQAYMLGISAGNPGHIVLAKGRIADGLPDAAPGIAGVLRRSSLPVTEWQALRIDTRIAVDGATTLKVSTQKIDPERTGQIFEQWDPIPGMADFVDDAAGVATGSAPLSGGRLGFATTYFVASTDERRFAYFGQVSTMREN